MAQFKHNKVDIYLKEKNGKRQIRLPWLPDNLDFDSGGVTTANYEILNKGEVAVTTANGLASFSWSGTFPGPNRKNSSMQRGTWQDPSTYHRILKDWQAKGTIINIMATGYPINMDVFLLKYQGKAVGGFGDWEYTIEFQQYKDITVTSKKIAKTKDQNKTKKREAKKTTGVSYTIRSGDTLWGIASRFLGSGLKWKNIYNANKTIIESTAKKRGMRSSDNGHWIFPGVTIQIPK